MSGLGSLKAIQKPPIFILEKYMYQKKQAIGIEPIQCAYYNKDNINLICNKHPIL